MERVEASLVGENKQLEKIGGDFYQGSMKSPVPKTKSAVYPVTVTATGDNGEQTQESRDLLVQGSGIFPLKFIATRSTGEELGYIGALALLFLLLLISIIGARTVRRAKLKGDTASAVLVAGFTIYIVLQSVVNMLYASLVLPLPGMLLPFFSYSPSDEVLTIMIASILYRLIFIMGRENEKR